MDTNVFTAAFHECFHDSMETQEKEEMFILSFFYEINAQNNIFMFPWSCMYDTGKRVS